MSELAEAALFGTIAARMAEETAGDASGHDVFHAWRVFSLGRRIAAAEGADATVVGAAALTHDLHRIVAEEEFVHPRETLPTVWEMLDTAGLSDNATEAACHCVAVHEEYDFDYGHGDERGAETLEAEVLQDADNLDAIGAVGVGRAFAFGGAHDTPMWDADPSPDWVDWAPETTGESVLAHFEAKLRELAADMNTETGQQLAADRHEFLVAFERRFRREWLGDA